MKKKFFDKQTLKYDFSTPESQKLLQEFTVLIGEIMEYVEKLEEDEETANSLKKELELNKSQILYLENELICNEEKILQLKNEITSCNQKLIWVNRIRYLFKVLVVKLLYAVYKIISFIPRRIKRILKRQ